jgi:hypothetical protein
MYGSEIKSWDCRYESADWLNLSGEHRVSLGLPFERSIDDIDLAVHRANHGKTGLPRGARGRPVRLVLRSGIEDYPHRNAAARALGVSIKTMETWMRVGPPTEKKSTAWPDSLMCFRYLRRDEYGIS